MQSIAPPAGVVPSIAPPAGSAANFVKAQRSARRDSDASTGSVSTSTGSGSRPSTPVDEPLNSSMLERLIAGASDSEMAAFLKGLTPAEHSKVSAAIFDSKVKVTLENRKPSSTSFPDLSQLLDDVSDSDILAFLKGLKPAELSKISKALSGQKAEDVVNGHPLLSERLQQILQEASQNEVAAFLRDLSPEDLSKVSAVINDSEQPLELLLDRASQNEVIAFLKDLPPKDFLKISAAIQNTDVEQAAVDKKSSVKLELGPLIEKASESELLAFLRNLKPASLSKVSAAIRGAEVTSVSGDHNSSLEMLAQLAVKASDSDIAAFLKTLSNADRMKLSAALCSNTL